MVTRTAVSQLAQDVQVPGVASRLLDHVDEHPAHRDGVTKPGRPGIFNRQLADDRVAAARALA